MDKKQELRNKNLEGNKCNIWTLSALIRILKKKNKFSLCAFEPHHLDVRYHRLCTQAKNLFFHKAAVLAVTRFEFFELALMVQEQFLT